METQTLLKLQKYYKEKAKERGFDKETAEDTSLLLVEELGELARAIRKHSGIKIDSKTPVYEIEEELADVFIYLLHLSNILDIDLEEAEMGSYYHEKAGKYDLKGKTAKNIVLLISGENVKLAEKVSGCIGTRERTIDNMLVYLLHLANILNVDLEKAFWKKEKENNQRKWN